MKPATFVRCDECKVPRRPRPNGVLIRHNAGGSRCPGSNEAPPCALCRIHHGTKRTVSPTVFLCAACDRAVTRGDAVEPCTGKGCTNGRVEPYAAGEPDRECPVCKGHNVVYVPKGPRA